MSVLAFLIIGSVALLFAILLVTLPSAVHGALCLVVTFGALAVFFVTLGAEFIAVVQVAVYAGAIMVLFLFVMMLLNIQGELDATRRGNKMQMAVAAALGLALLVEIAVLAPRLAGLHQVPAARVDQAFGSPEHVGIALYTQYLLPFEVTSLILLAAMVGAVVLAKRRLD